MNPEGRARIRSDVSFGAEVYGYLKARAQPHLKMFKFRVLSRLFCLRHSREARALVEVQIPGILTLEARLVAREQ